MQNRRNKTCRNCHSLVASTQNTCVKCGGSQFLSRPECIGACAQEGLLGSVRYRSTRDKEWRCSQCGEEFSQDEYDGYWRRIDEARRAKIEEARRAKEKWNSPEEIAKRKACWQAREAEREAEKEAERLAQEAAAEQAAKEAWHCNTCRRYSWILVFVVISLLMVILRPAPQAWITIWIIFLILKVKFKFRFFSTTSTRHKCSIGERITLSEWFTMSLVALRRGIVYQISLSPIWVLAHLIF